MHCHGISCITMAYKMGHGDIRVMYFEPESWSKWASATQALLSFWTTTQIYVGIETKDSSSSCTSRGYFSFVGHVTLHE